MEFDLSDRYCKVHFLDPLDLNLLCVRVKDPANKLGKDAGYWVGHFQISEELRKKEDAKSILEMVKEMASAKDFLADGTVPIHSSQVSDMQDARKINESTLTRCDLPLSMKKVKQSDKRYPEKKDKYRPVLARLIDSSTPIPDSLIAERFYVTVELISLSIPDRLVTFELCVQALSLLFLFISPLTNLNVLR